MGLCPKNSRVADYVINEKNALVVKPHDARGMREAILRLYHNDQPGNKIALTGKRDVDEKYSTDMYGDRGAMYYRISMKFIIKKS